MSDSPFQLFPMLEPAIEAALRASIERFGVLVPVVHDQHGRIIDGYHRSRIAHELDVHCPVQTMAVTGDDHARELALTLNTDRRHLDPEQRHELVAVLRSNGHSLRAIGGALGISKDMVARDLATVAPETVPDRIVGRDGKSRPAHMIRPGDVVADDEGEAHLVEDIEEIDDEIVLHADDGEALIVGSDREIRITKPDLGGGISHPARYSDALLPILADAVPPDEYPVVLDPFAGTGKIHQLPNDTVGVEIEPEWARLHPDTICASALALPFSDGHFDAVVTSPTYGNRLADSHNASDPETRRSYTHDLGRPLHGDNSGAMQWGPEYCVFHVEAWCEAIRVLRPGGRFVLNIKDHIRGGRRQHVAGWHVTTLVKVGLEVERFTDVPTPNLRQGDNADVRLCEQVIVFRRPMGEGL